MDVAFNSVVIVTDDKSVEVSAPIHSFRNSERNKSEWVTRHLHDWLQAVPKHGINLSHCHLKTPIANKQYCPAARPVTIPNSKCRALTNSDGKPGACPAILADERSVFGKFHFLSSAT